MTSTRAAVALLSAGALSGCVSLKRTPEARFFALRPVAVLSASPAPNPAHDRIVGVLPVSLPGFIERPQLVTWSGPGEVRIDEFLRWAEPLDASVQRLRPPRGRGRADTRDATWSFAASLVSAIRDGRSRR